MGEAGGQEQQACSTHGHVLRHQGPHPPAACWPHGTRRSQALRVSPCPQDSHPSPPALKLCSLPSTALAMSRAGSDAIRDKAGMVRGYAQIRKRRNVRPDFESPKGQM